MYNNPIPMQVNVNALHAEPLYIKTTALATTPSLSSHH